MDDLNLLLRRIIEEPDDDILRLAYADALEELESAYVKCGNCKGEGGTRTFWGNRNDRNAAHFLWTECLECKGAAQVPDTTNRDRAEFIRTQIELSNLFSSHRCERVICKGILCVPGIVDVINGCPPCNAFVTKRDELQSRELALLANLQYRFPVHQFFHWERGFLESIQTTAEIFLEQADALIWHPKQTIPCPTCRGLGHFNKGNEDYNTCPEECAKHPDRGAPCDGSGRVYRPCPPTAQPIRKVILTAGLVDVLQHIRWAEDGKSIWRSDKWPGVEFELPEMSA